MRFNTIEINLISPFKNVKLPLYIFIVTEQPYHDLLTETKVSRDTGYYLLYTGRQTTMLQTIYQAF